MQASATAVGVVFKAKKPVKFGEVLKVVGGAPQLGDWDAAAAPAMRWSDGDNWTLEADLEPQSCSFKCVIFNTGTGAAIWEDGDNRTVEVRGGV